MWSNPRVRSAVDCGETSQGDLREETVVGNACGGKSGSHGSKAIPLSHAQGVEPAPSPVSARIPPPAGEQQRLALQAPAMRSNREGPQAGEPSNCLSRQSNREGLPRDLLITSCQRLHKDSGRATAPVAETVHVPAHLVPPGSPQPERLHHLHARSSLG